MVRRSSPVASIRRWSWMVVGVALSGGVAASCASGASDTESGTPTDNEGQGGTAGSGGTGAGGKGGGGKGGGLVGGAAGTTGIGVGGVSGQGGSGPGVGGGGAGGLAGHAGATTAGGSGGAAGHAGAATGGKGGSGGSTAGASGAAGSGGGDCADQKEICDAVDNNCNGKVDEGDPGGGVPCTVPNKKGECALGTTHCKAGMIVCQENGPPVTEICDGKDNDCNGAVDDDPTDVGGSCSTGLKGICGAGTKACVAGQVTCQENLPSTKEVCNGLDDDCDGTIDNGFAGAGMPCMVTGQMPNTPCAAGQTSCMSGQDNCVQTNMASPESCDGIDNDCNGTIDDPTQVTGKVCDTGLPGVCKDGKTDCNVGKPSCVAQIKPGDQLEVCDGKDNDCDGMVDNVTNIKLECTNKNPSAGHVIKWACVTAACEVQACSGAFKDCDSAPANGCETDSNNDPLNCGDCGQSCSDTNGTPGCSAGTCTIACAAGFGNCDGNIDNGCETPTVADPTNCGGCGVTCNSVNGTASCANSACAIVCAAGFGDCDGNPANGCETNLGTDTNNCGACKAACGTQNGTASCKVGACEIACTAGFADCNDDRKDGCEVNLKVDTTHCGTCGNACSMANGAASCANGACGISCSVGFGDCDGDETNGCETNTNSSTADCGGCGKACDSTHGTASCTAGACAIACAANFGDCNNKASDGCETDLRVTPTSCGTCGKVCDSTHGTAGCVNSACTIQCAQGYGDCDANAPGCETSLDTNAQHCGTCTNVCSSANGGPSCAGGVCSITCNPGFAKCPSNTGCDTMVSTDANNCGTCGNVCQANNTTSNTCASGTCIPVCKPGFANCDMNGSNGCETSLTTDKNNCGGCGIACPLTNATSTACVAGGCLPTCAPGYGNCDGNGLNGCEDNINSDANNCGACNKKCILPNATSACSGGSCAITGCSGSFADCDNNPIDGCEANTASDVNNCGGCGHVCSGVNGTRSCTAGVCNIACNPGFGDCDGNPNNGCEVNLTNDVNHCGTCGGSCGAEPAVTGSACVGSACHATACSAGYYDTDGVYTDGCECHEDTVPNSCAGAVNLGTIPVDGALAVSSYASLPLNLTGAGNTDEDWFAVTFAVGPSCNWSPSITLVAGSLPIAIQVYTGCSGGTATGSYACNLDGAGTSTASIQHWEARNSGACGYQQSIDPNPASGVYSQIPATAYIRVLKTGSNPSCMNYSLGITN